MMKDSTINNQWAVLGATRLFLAGIVLFGHIAHFSIVPQWAETISHLDPFSAVLAFFLISGFSIAASLEKESGGRAYYDRRINRIYPAYLASFLLGTLPFLIWGQNVSTNGYGIMQAPHSMWDFVGGAFLLQGLLTNLMVTIAPSWTLGLEAQLYLIAPLLQRLRTPLLLVLVSFSLFAFLHYGRLTHTDLTQMRFGEGTAFLGWAWVLGFVYYRHRHQVWAKAALTGGALFGGCVHVAGVGQFGPLTIGITVFALMFGDQVKTSFAKYLTYAGDFSYPLYVVHWPVMVLLAGGDSERSFWFYLTLPIVGALILLHTVDLPYRVYARQKTANNRSKVQVFSATQKFAVSAGIPYPDTAPDEAVTFHEDQRINKTT